MPVSARWWAEKEGSNPRWGNGDCGSATERAGTVVFFVRGLRVLDISEIVAVLG
jgi:hypothetical protein